MKEKQKKNANSYLHCLCAQVFSAVTALRQKNAKSRDRKMNKTLCLLYLKEEMASHKHTYR